MGSAWITVLRVFGDIGWDKLEAALSERDLLFLGSQNLEGSNHNILWVHPS
jgi:hypothetical protein